MADAQDSKSCDGNIMTVRPRPPAPYTNKTNLEVNTSDFVLFFTKDWFAIQFTI